MAKGTGKKCGASYISKVSTCRQGKGARAAVGLTAGTFVVGAMSSKRVRAQMGFAIQKGITNTVHKATASKPSMKFNKQSFKRSLRKQNPLIGAHLRTHAMRRKHEPGFRNNKKRFWADGFEGELQAGLFHMDKKCGASGIPDNAKCNKGVGRTVAQQKKRESVPKDKEHKQLRALEKEMDKNAPPKRNILQKVVRKVSGKEKLERNLKEISRLKKKYGANSVEANGGEGLNPKGATYKWIKKNRPDLNPDKIGANSKLADKLSRQVGDSMDLTPAALRADACWKGYVQKGVKRKGNRMVPNCQPVKAKKDSVWAEGFTEDAGPNLSEGRGEKLPASKGGGLTKKGREKYNKATGSNLQAPVTGKVKPGSKAAHRRENFCSRSRSWKGERGLAARRRWKCR